MSEAGARHLLEPHLWASQGKNRHAMARADVVNRELVLAAVPDPQRVASLIQTLLHPSAS